MRVVLALLFAKVDNCHSLVVFSRFAIGGMAEWFKAAVLKTVERKLRGFESYSLRQKNQRADFYKLGEMAE